MWQRCLGVLIAVCSMMTFTLAYAGSPISVVFINPGGTNEFWGDVSETMAAAAEDLEIELEIIHTNRDRLAMVNAAKEVAARTTFPDYVVVVNELKQAPVMLNILSETKIPVFVLLNRMTDDQRVAYASGGGDLTRLIGSIVPDNEIAGYEMAISLIEKARGLRLDEDGIQMLALLGDAATPAALAREAGLRRALAENPDVNLVRSFPVMWNQDTARERAGEAFKRFPIDSVWSANDQISFGAQAAAIEANEIPGETVVFAGLNWSKEGLIAVREGAMTMTHGGHFFAGAWSMVILRDLADGMRTENPQVEFPMSAVTTASVEQFLEFFGDRDWRGIDFSEFQIGQQENGTYDFSATAILSASHGVINHNGENE